MSATSTRTRPRADRVPAPGPTGDRIVAELERARGRTLGLLDRLTEDEQRAQVSTADVAARVGPRPHRQLRGAVAAPRDRRARPPSTPTSTTSTTPSSTPAGSGRPCRSSGPTRPAPTCAGCATTCSSCSTGVDLGAADPTPGRLLDRGFVYGMVIQHEHQHDETLLATHQLRGRATAVVPSPVAPTPAATVRSARRRLAATRRPRGSPMVAVDGGRRSWARPTTRGPTTTSAAPTWSSWRPFRIDTFAVTNRDLPRSSSPTAATTTTGCGPPPAGPGGDEAELEHPAVLAAPRATGRGPSCASASGSTSTTTSTSRCSTCAGTRPTRSPAGPASACRPKPSGRRPPRWHPTDGQQRVALGRRRRRPRRGPTSASAATGPDPAGARPGGRQPVGLPRHDRRRVGVDVVDLPARTPGFEAWPYRGVLRGVLGRRLPGAPRRLVGRRPDRGARSTFRNWDYPIRRQIFAGFRCARDA